MSEHDTDDSGADTEKESGAGSFDPVGVFPERP